MLPNELIGEQWRGQPMTDQMIHNEIVRASVQTNQLPKYSVLLIEIAESPAFKKSKSLIC